MTPNDTLDVWTLKLREGAYWQDGEVLDIDDVIFTMNLLLNDDRHHGPGIGFPGLHRFY